MQNSTYVNFATTIPTAAAFALASSFAIASDDLSLEQHHFLAPSGYYAQDTSGFGSSQTKYRIADDYVDSLQKLEAIHKFASNLLENIEDLDPEFSKVVDENYWDLI